MPLVPAHAVPLVTRLPQNLEDLALVGDPSATLAQASGELDLLVCGSPGRSRPLAAILGSDSTNLVPQARCHVLVVPPVASHDAAGPLGVTSAAASA